MEKLQIPGTQQTQTQEASETEKTSGDVPEDIDLYYQKMGGDDEEDEAVKNLQLLTFEVFFQKKLQILLGNNLCLSCSKIS